MQNQQSQYNNSSTIIGQYKGRYSNEFVAMSDTDRMRSMYVIGRSGCGKTTLLSRLAISDIQRGHGMLCLDPHGEMARSLLSYVPPHRIKDVIYFNAADTDFPIAFNPLQTDSKKERYLIASGIISTFKKMWGDAWGNRLEHIMRFSVLGLLEYPDTTLLDITRILTDENFRSAVVQKIQNPMVKAFWRTEFARYTPAQRQEAISPILNKLGLFAANDILRNIVGQPKSSLNFSEIIAARKILICNFAKGVLGEDACSLLGSVIINGLQLAAIRRANTPGQLRTPYFLYVDEAHTFVSVAYIDYLSELRKWSMSVFLTHQYLEQLNPKVAAAIFGNVGTIISFALGNSDAAVLSKEFLGAVKPRDFLDLPKYHMCLRLMHEGIVMEPFSAVALPITAAQYGLDDEIVAHTRTYFCKPVSEIELMLYQRSLVAEHTYQNSLF